MMIDEINMLLAKIRCGITVQYDIMEEDENEERNLHEWLILIEQNRDEIYVQSKSNKLYIKIADEIYNCYTIDHVWQDRKKLRQLCTNPIKVSLSNIEEYSGGVIDSYIGISANITAQTQKINYNIFKEKSNVFDNNHDDNSIKNTYDFSNNLVDKENFPSIQIIEDRKHYIYFKINGISFEAKELVGNFYLYCEKEEIVKCKNKNDALNKAELYIKEASLYF